MHPNIRRVKYLGSFGASNTVNYIESNSYMNRDWVVALPSDTISINELETFNSRNVGDDQGYQPRNLRVSGRQHAKRYPMRLRRGEPRPSSDKYSSTTDQPHLKCPITS